MWIPVVLLGVGAAALLYVAFSSDDGPVPVHDPDLPPMPGSTRYKLIDKILPELRKASEVSGIPLGLLIGWIAKESGGRMDEVTKLDERGIFQLHPDESKALGLDHRRLSTDFVYSINAGLLLIGKYMKAVEQLGVAPAGSEYFWRLVKLYHTMGSGASKKIVELARVAGEAGSWKKLLAWALANEQMLFNVVKHSPTKWMPFVDKIFDVGRPFGVGSGDVLVGAAAFPDIIDPLDCLEPGETPKWT